MGMTTFATRTLIATLLSLLFLGLLLFLSHQADALRDTATPFECGFDPKHSARTPFSLRFFLLAIIFLIFDVEIVILLPAPLLNTTPAPLLNASLFLLAILGGLFHE